MTYYQPWTQSRSGHPIDLLTPLPSQINFDDMAHSLSRLFRFNGNALIDISVARHSINVAEALRAEGHPPETCLYGLLHDGHEYVVGDITRPAQDLIAAIYGSFKPFKDHVRAVIDPAIFRAAGLAGEMPLHVASAVKLADDRMLASEMRDFMAVPARPWAPLPPPYPATTRRTTHPDFDRDEFALMLDSYMRKVVSVRLMPEAIEGEAD